MQCRELGDAGVRDRFSARLRAASIDPSRVDMQGEVPRAEYLRAYADVDVILVTFPFNGVTTTCEALWMGVTIVTLAGCGLRDRECAGVRAGAGLTAWITSSRQEYIDRAIAVTTDFAARARWRQSLRAQMVSSPLMDGPGFVRQLEDALWAMWRHRAATSLPGQFGA